MSFGCYNNRNGYLISIFNISSRATFSQCGALSRPRIDDGQSSGAPHVSRARLYKYVNPSGGGSGDGGCGSAGGINGTSS